MLLEIVNEAPLCIIILIKFGSAIWYAKLSQYYRKYNRLLPIGCLNLLYYVEYFMYCGWKITSVASNFWKLPHCIFPNFAYTMHQLNCILVKYVCLIKKINDGWRSSFFLVAVQTVVDKHVDIYYVILWQYFEHYCWVLDYSNKKPHCFLLSLMCGVAKTLYVF